MFRTLFLALVACFAGNSNAGIDYTITHLNNLRWLYQYRLTAEAGQPISEFTVYFPGESFSELSIGSVPANWDALVVQPDKALHASGFYDVLALGNPLVETSLNGFSAAFTFLGEGLPGPQQFDIVDTTTFLPISSGMTRLESIPSAIPEPPIVALVALGLIAVALKKRFR